MLNKSSLQTDIEKVLNDQVPDRDIVALEAIEKRNKEIAKGISNAIEDIIRMYSEGKIKNKPINHSVKWLKQVFDKN